MGKHTAMQVSEWLLSYNRMMVDEKGAQFISNKKLQRLLYYAQGCFLAITGSPLFNDNIVAWEYGPVVECVWKKYKKFEDNGIVFEEDFDHTLFTDKENDILEEVYLEFGQFSTWKLNDMSRQELPWKNTERNHAISIDVIKKFFENEYIDPQVEVDQESVCTKLQKEEYDPEEDSIWESLL